MVADSVRAALPAILLLDILGCGEKIECQSDYDCASDGICSIGECVAIGDSSPGGGGGGGGQLMLDGEEQLIGACSYRWSAQTSSFFVDAELTDGALSLEALNRGEPPDSGSSWVIRAVELSSGGESWRYLSGEDRGEVSLLIISVSGDQVELGMDGTLYLSPGEVSLEELEAVCGETLR